MSATGRKQTQRPKVRYGWNPDARNKPRAIGSAPKCTALPVELKLLWLHSKLRREVEYLVGNETGESFTRTHSGSASITGTVSWVVRLQRKPLRPHTNEYIGFFSAVESPWAVGQSLETDVRNGWLAAIRAMPHRSPEDEQNPRCSDR